MKTSALSTMDNTKCHRLNFLTEMTKLRSNPKIEKPGFVGRSGIFLLLVANFQFVATSVTWTSPPPAWTQTDPNDIRTVDKLVINGSTQVPLRWNYTLLSGSLVITTFSITLNDGNFNDIGTISGGNAVIFDRNDYRTRFNINGGEVATLIINKVTEREEAVYQCKLTTDSNTWSYRIRLIVTVPASLTDVSPDQTVSEGSNLQLLCNSTGKPAPNITWTRVLEDDSNSEVLHHGPTLDFPNINRNASGTYRCTAYNSFGNPASHEVKVNVTYPPKVANVSASKHYVEVQESVSLECTAEGNPQPTFSWKPCDQPQRVCQKSTLVVSEVLNDTVYICNATNSLGSNSGNVSVFIAGKVINVTLVITSESCADREYNETSLWTRLSKTISEAFANESRYISAKLRDVRCRNIIIDLALNFNSIIREKEVIDILRNAAEDGKLGEFTVNASSIRGTRPVDEKPTKAATATPSSSRDSKKWIIVGAVLGSLALLAVAVVVGWFVYRKRKCKKRDTKVHNNGSHEEAGGNVPNEGYVEVNKGYEGKRSSVPPVIYDTAQTSNRAAVKEPPQYSVVDKSKKNPKKRKPGELQYAELAEFSSGQGKPRTSTSPTYHPTETQYADVNAM